LHPARRLTFLALGAAAVALVVYARRRPPAGDAHGNGSAAKASDFRRRVERARERIREP
jgi:hypothetical protein